MSDTRPLNIQVTLKKSQTYIHQPTGLRFEFDVPKVVTEEVAQYLFTHATKSVKIDSGGRVSREDVRLFEFAPLDADDDLEDGDESRVVEPESLATALAKATPVQAPAASPTSQDGNANGSDGQARSRARGPSANKSASA